MLVTIEFEGVSKSASCPKGMDVNEALENLAEIMGLPAVPVKEGSYKRSDLNSSKFRPFIMKNFNSIFGSSKQKISVVDAVDSSNKRITQGTSAAEGDESSRTKDFALNLASQMLPELMESLLGSSGDADALMKVIMDEFKKKSAAESKPEVRVEATDVTEKSEPVKPSKTAGDKTNKQAATKPNVENKPAKQTAEKTTNPTASVVSRIPDDKFMNDAAVTGKMNYHTVPDPTVDVGKDIAKLANASLMPNPRANRVKPQMPTGAPAPVAKPVAIPPEVLIGREYIYDLIKTYNNNGFTIIPYWENGLLKLEAHKSNTMEIDNTRSITFDLDGLIVTPGAKWWPKVTHDRPVDFLPAYKYNVDDITTFINTGKLNEESIVFNEQVANLNRIVDLRTFFNIVDIDTESIQHAFRKMSRSFSKSLGKQVKAECGGCRFILESYADKNTFTLTTAPSVYKNIGGYLANNDTTFKLVFEVGNPAKLVK